MLKNFMNLCSKDQEVTEDMGRYLNYLENTCSANSLREDLGMRKVTIKYVPWILPVLGERERK